MEKMNKLNHAVHDIHAADDSVRNRSYITAVHPVSKLLVTFFYILIVVSFPKYNVTGLISMILYLLIIGIWNHISVKETVRHIWPVLILVSIMGIANPFIDQAECFRVNGFIVTNGMISMLTLIVKGIFCVTASYFLIYLTGMDGICCSLRCLHVPKELVTVLFLICRYMIVLLKEVERMMQAYRLRAPKQKGLHWRTWGPFVGQVLLRSIDRGEMVYDSMQLRGYNGELHGKRTDANQGISICYVLVWSLLLICLRVFPVFQAAGSLLGF